MTYNCIIHVNRVTHLACVCLLCRLFQRKFGLDVFELAVGESYKHSVHLTGLTSGVVNSWWGKCYDSLTGIKESAYWVCFWWRPINGRPYEPRPYISCFYIYVAPMCCSAPKRPSFTFIHHKEPGLLQFYSSCWSVKVSVVKDPERL